MSSYTALDVGNTFKHYADYLENEIKGLNRVDTLPAGLMKTQKEISARKIAVDILVPIHKQFKLAAETYLMEASMKEDNSRDYPTEEIDWGDLPKW